MSHYNKAMQFPLPAVDFFRDLYVVLSACTDDATLILAKLIDVGRTLSRLLWMTPPVGYIQTLLHRHFIMPSSPKSAITACRSVSTSIHVSHDVIISLIISRAYLVLFNVVPQFGRSHAIRHCCNYTVLTFRPRTTSPLWSPSGRTLSLFVHLRVSFR